MRIGLIIIFVIHFISSCENVNKKESTSLKAIVLQNISDSIEMKYFSIVDSLNLNQALDEAKWRLYCIYIDVTCKLKPKFYNKNEQHPIQTFGMLSLRLRGVNIIQDTAQFYLKFYTTGNIPCDNETLEYPIVIIHSVTMNRISDSALFFNIADGMVINSEGGSMNSRYRNPLQPEVVSYIVNNKDSLDSWLREEAKKRKIIN